MPDDPSIHDLAANLVMSEPFMQIGTTIAHAGSKVQDAWDTVTSHLSDLAAKAKPAAQSAVNAVSQAVAPTVQAQEAAPAAAAPESAPAKPMTSSEFAQSIKAKYPAYKDVPDDVLTAKMLEKYPVYRDKVTQTSAKPAGQPITDWRQAVGKGQVIFSNKVLANTGALAPAIGGAIGGIVGGSGGPAGAIAGAAAGGMVGERARQYANALTQKEPLPTQGEAVQRMAVQGGVQGASQAAGEAIGAGMKAAGPWLMQKALKPTQSMLNEYRTSAPAVVQTLLDEGINVTQAGMDKLQKLLGATNQEIKEAIASAPGSIDKNVVASRALTTAQKLAQQTNPTKDLQAVGDTVEEFLKHPVYAGKLSVPEAQAMKIGTYQQIGKKYGEVSSAAIETQKALARGLKEEIAAEVPGIAGLNSRDSELMAALDATGRRVALSGNKDPVGFAWVAQHPTTFLAAIFDRSPAVKSMVARGLYQSAGSAARVAPQLIRSAVAALASLGSDESPAPASSGSSDGQASQ